MLVALSSLAMTGCTNHSAVKPLWDVQLPFHYIERAEVLAGVVITFGTDSELYTSSAKASGFLVGLDKGTGKHLWAKKIEASARYPQQGEFSGGGFAVADADLVCLREQDDALHAFDVHTGDERWTSRGVMSLLAIANGQVFVVDAGKKLSVLDAQTGTENRSVALPWRHEYIWCTRMLVDEGREYMAVDDLLTATDGGKTIWSLPLADSCVEMRAARGVLILSESKGLEVLDGATGRKLWEYKVEFAHGELPKVDGDIAYTGLQHPDENHLEGGFLRGLKLETGELVSETKGTNGEISKGVIYGHDRVDHYDPVSKFFVDMGYGYLWADSADGRLAAWDVKNGARLWTGGDWHWGWLHVHQVDGDIVYVSQETVRGAEPVRLFASRVGD
jgi:outer membrane protein assembly factor BamB